MDLVIPTNTFDPDSHFLFWKPGGTPWVEPEGRAWRLDPGTDLVLNFHFKITGKSEAIQPSVGLYFSNQKQTTFPMLVQLEHDGSLDIPPSERDFLASDDFRLPVDADVLAVYPHAHYLGHVLEGYATLPDGVRRWLIRHSTPSGEVIRDISRRASIWVRCCLRGRKFRLRLSC